MLVTVLLDADDTVALADTVKRLTSKDSIAHAIVYKLTSWLPVKMTLVSSVIDLKSCKARGFSYEGSSEVVITVSSFRGKVTIELTANVADVGDLLVAFNHYCKNDKEGAIDCVKPFADTSLADIIRKI